MPLLVEIDRHQYIVVVVGVCFRRHEALAHDVRRLNSRDQARLDDGVHHGGSIQSLVDFVPPEALEIATCLDRAVREDAFDAFVVGLLLFCRPLSDGGLGLRVRSLLPIRLLRVLGGDDQPVDVLDQALNLPLVGIIAV